MTFHFPYRYRVLIFLCSLTTLTYLDRICISLVGVRIKSAFGLNNQQFGWVLGSFALSYALFEIPSGAWGDRIGPKALFIRIVLWWSAFTAITGFATGLLSLMAIRFLFGMGEAGTYPNCMIVMSRWFPVQEMGRSLVWVGMGSQVGSAIAPLIVVPLAVAFGWQVPFFVIGAIGIIWVFACFKWFRNFPSEMKNIRLSEKEYIEKGRRYISHQHHLPWKIIFKHRTLWSLMLMYFCCQMANYFFVAWLPVYLEEGKHFTETTMKNITSLLFIAGILGLILGGFASDRLIKIKSLRFSRRLIGMTGLGGCGVMLLLTTIVNESAFLPVLLITANCFFSFGVMVSYAVCVDIGRNNSGTVTGAMNFFGQIGAFTLAILFGKIVSVTKNFNYPLLMLAMIMFAGALLWLAIDPSRQIKLTSEKLVSSPALEE